MSIPRASLLPVLVLPLLACSHVRAPASLEADPPPIRDISYAAEKREMIYLIDRRMNELTAQYTAELDAIRAELVDGLARITQPARLVAVDRALRGYGAAAEERYAAEIDRLVDSAVTRTVALVGQEARVGQPAVRGRVEDDVWDAAREIGLGADGAGYGFESGVREIDERAAVTIELLQGAADVEGLKDLGAIRQAEVLQLSRAFHHDVTLDELSMAAPALVADIDPDPQGGATVGRLLLFRTGEMESWRTERQDAEGVVVAFQNERLPLDRRFELVQLVRHRIVRGGMIVEDFGWMLDPSVPGRRGRLELTADLADPRVLASETMFPGINVDHDLFDRLHDFQVVYDYKTALVDAASGQALGAIRWQLTWVVSHNGQVRVLDPIAPEFEPATPGLAQLLRDGDRGLPGAGQSAPSDLLATRRASTDSPSRFLVRDLGGGARGPVAEPVAPDHVRLTPAGRRFLRSNRLRIAAGDVHLFSFMDGRRSRYVLSITKIEEGSVLLDLGFRANDDVHEINGVPIRRFLDLWNYLNEHDERRYRVLINRDGALRWLTFDVPEAPADDPPYPQEELPDEMVEHLTAMFGG